MGIQITPSVIYSAMMGMVLLALFDVVMRKRQRQTLFLSGLLVLLLIHILGELHIYSAAYRYIPGIAGAHMPLRMLLGPALYFYALATMSPQQSINKKWYLLAFTGPVIVVVGMIPFAFGISAQEKLSLANPATRDPELFKIALATCLFAAVSFIGFTAAYLAATFKLHTRHRQQLMDRFSAIEKRSMDWFRVILYLWGFVWFAFTVEFTLGFLGIRWFGSGVVVPLLEASVLMAFIHYALKQPVLAASEKAPQQTPSQSSTSQARSSLLSAEQMKQIADKLNDVMGKGELYLEEDLSLNRLSQVVGVSENHISETLSKHLQTNFFHFVNDFRVGRAMTLLTETSKQVTVIMYDVGFNSKSTFNTAFKKRTGLTPSAYRKQQKMQGADDIAA